MRREILGVLQCPKCGGPRLRLTVSKENRVEIRRGRLACSDCRRSYQIAGGVIDLLAEHHPWVEKSRQAYRRSKCSTAGKWTAAELADRKHLNGIYTEDSRVNFEQALSLVPRGTGWALDLGAGTCWTTAALTGKGYLGIALDISRDNKLELGQEFFKHGVYFERILADMNRLPFRGGTVDLAFASAAYHHSHDLDAALAETARVLVPGGRLQLANEPVKGLAESFLGRGREFGAGEEVPENSYSITRWSKALRGSGFSCRIHFPWSIRRRMLGTGFSSSHKFARPAVLLSHIARWLPALLTGKSALWAGHLLFGLPLSLSGRKKT